MHEAIQRTTDKLKLWMQYTLTIVWQHSQYKLIIKLMMGIKQNGQLHFLYVLVEKEVIHRCLCIEKL